MAAAEKNTRKKNKELMIRIRVTADEHKEFGKRAKDNGFHSVSAFIRSLIEEKAVPGDFSDKV